MAALTRIVRGHPVLVFAFLACLIGWGNYICVYFGLGSNPDNMPLGPLLAALVVASFQGRDELRAWGRSLRNWKAAPKAYLLVVLVPIASHVVNVLVNTGLGAPLPTLSQLSHWPEIPVTFLVMLIMVGIGEEAGWTAFALPLMLRNHSVLAAWAAVSAIRITWHLPLMLNGEMPWVMGIVGNAAFTMVALQVMTLSGGRWSLMAVWHATLNAFGGAFFFSMVTGQDNTNLCLLLAGGYTVMAAALYFAVDQGRARRYLHESVPSLSTTPDARVPA